MKKLCAWNRLLELKNHIVVYSSNRCNLIHFSYSVRWAQGNSAASSRLKILDSISRRSVVHCAITSIKWATKSYARDCELIVRVTDHRLRVTYHKLFMWSSDHIDKSKLWKLITSTWAFIRCLITWSFYNDVYVND